MDDADTLRDDILLATLPNIVFDGWTPRVLRAGAEAAGHPPEAVLSAFPGGVADAVEHFSRWADRRMLEALAEHDLSSMRVRDRVALAVRLRLEVLASHEEAVRRALSFLALPQHLSLGARLIYYTVDAIWHAAGDTSTDFHWYTKRGLLAGVVSTTTLYWLNDSSEDKADTWAFLDRRIDDVLRIGRTVGGMGDIPGRLGRALWQFPSPTRFARQARQRLRDL